jgi:hypothetical protein
VLRFVKPGHLMKRFKPQFVTEEVTKPSFSDPERRSEE